MAVTEPGALFEYDRPLEKAPVDAVEMRNLFTALAQSHYTTDEDFPTAPRVGMVRLNAADATNVKLEIFQGDTWRVALQNIQGGVAAPAKQVVQVTTALSAWTIDHNLGSQPLVQVYDTAFRQMTPVLQFQRDVLSFGVVDLGVPMIAGPVGVALARYEGQIIEVYGLTASGIPSAAAITLQWEIDKTPSGGGVVPLGGGLVTVPAGPHPQGIVFPGSPVASANVFSGPIAGAGSEDILLATATGPSAPGIGLLSLHAVVERTLGPNQYHLDHPTENRITITHPQPTTGWVVLVG